jgi:hypothetical protein
VALALVATLIILAFSVLYLGGFNEVNAIFVYHSEVITNLAEAAIEETFLNFEEKLNDTAGNNSLYDQLRAPWDVQAGTEHIEIDAETMIEYAAAARAMAQEFYGIPPEKFTIGGRVTRIEPFLIRGFNPPDPIEKTAALEVTVTISLGSLTKVVVASRPVKVVRTTIPVLAESTLFVNNLAAEYFAHWPSVMGYDPESFPEPSKTVTLDHGWAKYSKTNKKGEFLSLLQDQVLPQGAVPPGRVYIREGIVPLTNGDRAAGALQKTFYSAESELMPVIPPLPLAALQESLGEDYLETTKAKREAELARQREEGIELKGPGDTTTEEAAPGPEGSTESSEATTGTSMPEDGELILRYLGSGLELSEKDISKYLGGNKKDSFYTYFSALADGPWGSNPPSKSGLDLFGRTTEKEKGKAVEGEGFFGKLWSKIKEIGAKLMSKLYAKYDIRFSPTLVYGSVLQSYYMARDFAFTGWWEKVKKSFGDKQIPIPYFPEGHFDGLSDEEPLKIEQLPQAWEEDFKKSFMKLPEEIRRPSFLKTLEGWATGITKKIIPLMPPSLGEKLLTLPQGTIVAPYHTALRTYLQPPPESSLDAWIDQYRKAGAAIEKAPGRGLFFSNVIDRQVEGIRGPYEPFFESALSDFNPFLFYIKATDYISSLWDPRLPKGAPAEQKNVFLRKFRDSEDPGLLHLNGVIYITGTEDLILKNFRYTGKAILITFGRVIFDGFFVKKQDSASDSEKNDLLTIISLGGIKFATSEPVHAQLYSYIYPFEVAAGEKMTVFGGIGCNELPLRLMGDGATINFDWTYHLDRGEIEKASTDAMPYYYVSITDEINKFEYLIRRDREEIKP